MSSRPPRTRRVVALLATAGATMIVLGAILVARDRGPDGESSARAATVETTPPGGPEVPTDANSATPPPDATARPSPGSSALPDHGSNGSAGDPSAATEVTGGAETSEPETPESVTPEPVTPISVRIDAIGVDAPMIGLGLNDDGTLEVPTDPGLTGWYTGRSVPGEVGPSIVVGHVDSTTGPAVFHDLRFLAVGDLIDVDRSDGRVAVFRVADIVHVNKQAFPTDDVYGPTDEPTLRLVTCTGAFDRDAKSYVDNVIVYGTYVELRNAAAVVEPL